MSDQGPGPVFVDLYGTAGRTGKGPEGEGSDGGGREPGGPEESTFRRCLEGREVLWKVFWAYGMFGVGVVMACAMGSIFLLGLVGLLASPVEVDKGLSGAVVGIVISVLIAVPYFAWIWVSLWRCAFNCENRLWGYAARGWVVANVGGLALIIARAI